MSSSKTASTASTASTTTSFDGYIDRIYEQNRKEAELAYANHMIAAKELHEAQMRMMTAKRAIRALNDELSQATVAAASATELVDRKRKAAAAAAEDFKHTSEMTRGCYGTEGAKRICSPVSPVYYAVSPVYSKKVETAKVIEAAKVIEISAAAEAASPAAAASSQESQDPYGGDETPSYNPTSASYVPQRPEGDGRSPRCCSPVGYCHITGDPIYSRNKPTSPRYAPTSPNYSATSPTYTPKTPPPLSPHTIAAAKRVTLKWGA